MNTWFIADEHYFHKNVIKYCNRPFDTVEKMNNALIIYHNETVGENDTVYHLGDFAFLRKDQIMKLNKIMERLSGNHILILGNHDESHPFIYLKMGFLSVHTSLFVDEFLLIHDPSHAVVADENQKVLCGHIHQISKFIGNNILNVGVDIWNYRPISIETVRETFNQRNDD